LARNNGSDTDGFAAGCVASGEVIPGDWMQMDKAKPRRKFHPVYLFLLLPFIAHVWVPSYNRIDPELFGIPFFYWWQMAWISCWRRFASCRSICSRKGAQDEPPIPSPSSFSF
jgi:hypothetical protein